MDQFVEGKSPYSILRLEKGQESSLEEIKKAYRRLALLKHPDKAKNKETAAQEFDELKKAYAILTDKSARAALDECLDAQSRREERLAKQDAKRQRLREELERKEKAGAAAKSEEEQARTKLKMELEALRARAQWEQQERQAAVSAAAAARTASSTAQAGALGRTVDAAAAAGAADADDETTQLLMRTVKATWDPHISNYTTDRLRQIFSAGWSVEDVILKDSSSSSKKKKKASVLVVLTSVEAAQQAAQEVHGDLENPLLVTPYLKVMPGAAGQQQQQQQQDTVATGRGGTPPAGAWAAAAAAAAQQQTLFASGLAGSTSRQVQRPSKPLFPGATPREPHPAGSTASQPFSSFPGMPPGQQQQQPDDEGGGTSCGGRAKFNSFPGMPAGAAGAAGAAGGSGGGSRPTFSSFPGMPGGVAAAGADASSSSKFSSFPAAGGAASIRQPTVNGVPVGDGFEDAVLQKLHQKGGPTAT